MIFATLTKRLLADFSAGIRMKSVLKALAVPLFSVLTFTANAQDKVRTPAGEAEKVGWNSVICSGSPFQCSALKASGQLFAESGQDKIVLISHGSQGVDARMYDYVKDLRKAGFAALVIDHWTPRGVSTTHNDYVEAARKGANETNIAFDNMTAAEWLRRTRGFRRVGGIGESQGGAAAIILAQKWPFRFLERNMERLYQGLPFMASPFDAVVGLYGFCGFRNTARDAYVTTPFLFITGSEDDSTPSRYCESYVPYMNSRGGNARIVVLEGEGHSFDAPYRRHHIQSGPQYAKCNIVVEKDHVSNVNTGERIVGQDSAPLFERCKGRGYQTGHGKDRFIAVPHWISFFKEALK
jgi:dienelactone hydrolase